MKKGQEVWYIDHVRDEIVRGTLVSTDNQSDRDSHPTLLVESYKYATSHTIRVLEDWVFTKRAHAREGLKEFLHEKILNLKRQENRIREKLNKLK